MSANSEAVEQPKQRKPGNRFKIEDFDLRRVLGEGMVGKVWYAVEKKKNFAVAIKTINKQHIKEAGLNTQVFNELYIHSGLEHPNILKFLTYFHDEESIYFVLEYARFGSLFSIQQNLESKRFDEACSAKYTSQIADGLLYLHSRQYLHGDIKPENILLDSRENIKLADFSLAWHYATAHRDRGFCGTIDYLAPEVLARDYHDFSIDFWSLGVLIYEFLTGECPFAHRKVTMVKQKIRYINYKFPNFLSEDSRDLIKKLLVKREDRINLHEVKNHAWIKRCYPQGP